MEQSTREVIELQAKRHPLVYSEEFSSLEDYCLFLMHQFAHRVAMLHCKGKSILDLGCNNGYGTKMLSTVAKYAVGCDVSLSALDDARRRFPEVNFLNVDGVKLPFADGDFDVVTSFQVIEHIYDIGPYLAEIDRVLKPGGVAIFTTPNAAIRLDPGMVPWNQFHVREYHPDELRDALRSRFPQVEVKGLFGSDEIYQVEYRRCQKALANARHRTNLKENLSRPNAGPAILFGYAKLVLPEPVLQWLRSKRTKRRDDSRKSTLSLAQMGYFRTQELYYRDDKLDLSLDLMAICKK